MSRDFPDWVNPWTAAEGRRIFSGTLPFAWMKRLGALLAGGQAQDDEGQSANFRAAFSLDGERRPVIELQVSAALPLVCQASLEEYLEPVERQTLLGVARSEEDMMALPDNYEPVLADSGRLALAQLVEDELLLAMPQIPRRPDMDPVRFRSGSEASNEVDVKDRRKPFAGLQQMLRENQENSS